MPQVDESKKAEIPARMFTYFVGQTDTAYIKIGKSTDPLKRLISLQTGCATPLSLLACGLSANGLDEKDLHYRFADFRLNGEWFTASPEILELIERVGIDPETKARIKGPSDWDEIDNKIMATFRANRQRERERAERLVHRDSTWMLRCFLSNLQDAHEQMGELLEHINYCYAHKQLTPFARNEMVIKHRRVYDAMFRVDHFSEGCNLQVSETIDSRIPALLSRLRNQSIEDSDCYSAQSHVMFRESFQKYLKDKRAKNRSFVTAQELFKDFARVAPELPPECVRG